MNSAGEIVKNTGQYHARDVPEDQNNHEEQGLEATAYKADGKEVRFCDAVTNKVVRDPVKQINATRCIQYSLCVTLSAISLGDGVI